MTELFQQIQEVDLSGWAVEFMDRVNGMDPALLGVLIAIAVCLGHKLALGHRLAYGLGLRLGVLTLLCHGGYRIIEAGGVATQELLAFLIPSFLWAGIVLASAWIILPFALFLFCYFRFGLLGFLGYGGYVLTRTGSFDSLMEGETVGRMFLAAGLAMVAAWLLQPAFQVFAARWPTPAPTQIAAPPPPVNPESAWAPVPTTWVAAFEDPSVHNLKRLHGWFLDEERRIQMLDLDAPQKQSRLLVLQEIYVSLSQRFIQEDRIDVVPVIPFPEKERLMGQAACSA